MDKEKLAQLLQASQVRKSLFALLLLSYLFLSLPSFFSRYRENIVLFVSWTRTRPKR